MRLVFSFSLLCSLFLCINAKKEVGNSVDVSAQLQQLQNVKASIVIVHSEAGVSGSGIILSPYSVLTAAHVVRESDKAEVYLQNDKRKRDVTKISVCSTLDLAILEVGVGFLPCAEIGNSVKEGQAFLGVGIIQRQLNSFVGSLSVDCEDTEFISFPLSGSIAGDSGGAITVGGKTVGCISFMTWNTDSDGKKEYRGFATNLTTKEAKEWIEKNVVRKIVDNLCDSRKESF